MTIPELSQQLADIAHEDRKDMEAVHEAKGYARATEKYLDLLSRIRKDHHDEDCDSLNEDKDVVIGEVGTGPWDTAMEPAPCTCGYDAACKECDDILKPLK